MYKVIGSSGRARTADLVINSHHVRMDLQGKITVSVVMKNGLAALQRFHDIIS